MFLIKLQLYHYLKAAIIEEFMIFLPHLAFCWLQISDLWVTWCNHIETWKGQHYPVYTSIVLFLMQQQKSQSAIKERKLGQIAHCSAHCGRPNYHQNYTRVLELGSASPRDAQFWVPVKTVYRENWPSQDQKTKKKKCKIRVKLAKKICVSRKIHIKWTKNPCILKN